MNRGHVSNQQRRRLVFILIALVLMIYVSVRLFAQVSTNSVSRVKISHSYNRKLELNELNSRAFVRNNKLIEEKQVYEIKKKWFLKMCLGFDDQSEMTFEQLDGYLEKFSKSSIDVCKVVNSIFMSMFDLEVSYGTIEISASFKTKILSWLNNNEKYLELAKKQKLIKIYNKYYKDEMIYNSIRSKRPQPIVTGPSSERNYSFSLIEESRVGCDFCGDSYKTNTADDVFERIESKLSFAAANAFKYDKWHSLIFSRNHNTLNLTEEEITDMFSLSLKWFQKVNDIDPNAQYPQFVWDAMPKSGASQVHTHIHVSMSARSYYGMMRRWLEASSEYFLATYRDFYDDFVLIHKALGLAYEINDCYVIFNLIPVKDQEVMIVGKSYPNSFTHVVKLLHQVSRIFIDKFEQFSFSSGIYLPKFDNSQSEEYNPGRLTKISARILFRSQVNSVKSDFNALDLYTNSVIGVDRFSLASKLFKELDILNGVSQ